MGSSGSALSNIVPWNLRGALLAGTLGLAATTWAPYVFMGYLTPVVAFVMASIRKDRLSDADAAKVYGEGLEELSEAATELA